jgi:hypothetical protein
MANARSGPRHSNTPIYFDDLKIEVEAAAAK